ncbi:MAG: bifunctional UDP-N-acetylglucosamine diphosphorylase/glucosamine-1-phosphate N-acetyltransferase GlmU, partial [Acidimicrobiia bacterium]|nr:bifunctional UDP-N-acetylglucosamine diphosphorylase/glucosamine-1-phosphate N-acetyltransferase GlmU [Acidimicrobiia bacterium]
GVDGDAVLVIPGDTPLLRPETLRELVELHNSDRPAATMLTARIENPFGYGRVLRDDEGNVTGIVEHRDATPEQLAVDEINAGVYIFDGNRLAGALGRVNTDNAQGEYYLPDVLALLVADGHAVSALLVDGEEISGVNSQQQLAEVSRLIRGRINGEWMDRGVWMADPEQVFIDADVQLAAGVRLYPGVYLEGATSIGEGAEIGPDTFIVDGTVGSGAHVWYAVVRQAEIGDEAEVGPYVSLRPGTILGPRSKAGTFVEMKNAVIGEKSKVPHLAYMGDVEVGVGANIGAGTITVNYDGFEKFRTLIKDRARVGSDTMLIAPVTIGEGAFTGAGSVISRDVPDGALAIERSQQKEIPGYAARREERYRRKTEET